MDNMMHRMDQEFGSMFGRGFGGSLLGGSGDLGGRMFEGFNQMISSAHRQESGLHGPGTFSSTSFMMSSSGGSDGSGKPHVEAYSESTVGGRDRNGELISETRQQYKNSATALERVALEQAHGSPQWT